MQALPVWALVLFRVGIHRTGALGAPLRAARCVSGDICHCRVGLVREWEPAKQQSRLSSHLCGCPRTPFSGDQDW